MRNRVTPLGRATAHKRRVVHFHLPKLAHKSESIKNSVFTGTEMGRYLGALCMSPEIPRLLPAIIQMMRTSKTQLVRKYAERAYMNELRGCGGFMEWNKRNRENLASRCLAELITKTTPAVALWLQEEFGIQKHTPPAGGGRGGEIKDGLPTNDEPPTESGGGKGYTIEDNAVQLPSGVPRRSAIKLDTGRWNMLGQSIVDSANASRRAYTRRDCDSGMLDNRKLTDIGSGTNLERVFIQQKPARSKRVAVELLIDISGSMESQTDGEHNIHTAASMSKSIVDAFNKGGIDCRVVLYNHNSYEAKAYHQKQAKFETLWCNGNTRLGDAMAGSLNSIRKRNADRKIIIAVSDGDAGCHAPDVAVSARNYRVETYAFFIGVGVPDEVKQSFTEAFGELSPKACVGEVCGAVRRSLAVK